MTRLEQPPIGERRRDRRLPYNKPVHVVLIRQGRLVDRPTELVAEDISHSGIGLRGAIEFKPGHTGVLQLRTRSGERAVLGVHVVHAEACGDGGARAGARFFHLAPDFVRSALVTPEGRVRCLDNAEEVF